MTQIWFARVGSLSGPGSRMTPVSREGWLVVAGFLAAMLVGAVLFFLLLSNGAFALGIALYAVIAIVAGGAFLCASIARGDQTKTAADYRRMRGG